MPKPDWGIDPDTIDDFDREGQFKPYTGPTPPDGVYRFRVKQLKYAAGTKSKNPQLRPGLELVPRNKDEKRFAQYFIMCFLPVSERTAFRYVPFLDAIGVSGKSFISKTVVDEDGNITRIGKWRMEGDTEILAQIRTEEDQNGQPRKDVKWFGAYDPDADEDYEEDDDEDEDYEDDDDE